MSDALKDFKPPKSGDFINLPEDAPVKIRVLTTDPLANRDRYGNTRFAFVVWSHDEERPMILNKGMSILNPIRQLHLDQEWGGDVRQVDIRISATGEGKETRYTVTPLPNSKPLKNEQIKASAGLKLEEIIKHGIRLGEVNEGLDIPENPDAEEQPAEEEESAKPGYAKAKAQRKKLDKDEEADDEVVIEDIGDEPINLDDIPF